MITRPPRHARVVRSAFEELVDGDDVAAARTAAARAEPSAESIASSAALLAEIAGVALGTLVDDVVAAGPGQVLGAELSSAVLMTAASAKGDHPAYVRNAKLVLRAEFTVEAGGRGIYGPPSKRKGLRPTLLRNAPSVQ